MISVINFDKIDDSKMLEVAKDLSELLCSNNKDIAIEFPDTFLSYSTNPEQVYRNLKIAQNRCEIGVRQQFILFCGEKAVGMSVIRITEDTPDIFDYNTPNASGFVCNPYRQQGIGRASLLTRLKVVEEQFNGVAWTRVKRQNLASQKLVCSTGFQIAGEDSEGLLYFWQIKKSRDNLDFILDTSF